MKGKKLNAAGVPVVSKRYKGVIHGFISMDKILKQSDEALNEISKYMRKEFDRG